MAIGACVLWGFLSLSGLSCLLAEAHRSELQNAVRDLQKVLTRRPKGTDRRDR